MKYVSYTLARGRNGGYHDLGVRRTQSHLCLLALGSRALAKSRQLQLGLGILMPGSWMATPFLASKGRQSPM